MSNGIASLVNFDPNRNVFSFADSYTNPVVEDVDVEDEEVIVEDPVETLDTIIREGGGGENNPYLDNYEDPGENFGYDSWDDMFADISDGVSDFFGMGDEDGDDDEEGFSLTNNPLVNNFRSLFSRPLPSGAYTSNDNDGNPIANHGANQDMHDSLADDFANSNQSSNDGFDGGGGYQPGDAQVDGVSKGQNIHG